MNFDNLLLRALAQFNYYPPTYDLAILKDRLEIVKSQVSKTNAINPEESAPWYNWGIVLYDLAMAKTGPEKEKLLQESCEKCAKAAIRNPKNAAINSPVKR